MHGHAADVLADQLALARVRSDANLDSELVGGAGDRQRTAQRARGGTVEGGQKAVAHRLDRAPAVAVELGAHALIVLGEQIAPGAVAEPGRARGRIDDVGEHDRQQRPGRLDAAAVAGEELLDLLENRVAVAEEGKRIDPVELDVAGAGDVLGEIARVATRPTPVRRGGA